MDSSHSSLPLHDLHTRQTQTQLLSSPHGVTHQYSHLTQDPPLPPARRRRTNSGNPPTTKSLTVSSAANSQAHFHISSHSSEPVFDTLTSRNESPDQTSRDSTIFSIHNSGPQLRKKPKSSSIKNTNILRAATAAILKSPSLPAFHSTPQPECESSQHGTTGQPVSRTNSGTSQHQSPNQRRPPASHSSYGVETICGPPPSYSTQRTLSQERIRKLDRNTLVRMQISSSDSSQAIASDDTYEPHVYTKESAPSLAQSSPDTADTQSIPTPTEVDNMATVKIRSEQRTLTDEEGKASSSDERRSEDLFLNIARVDAARPVEVKHEKKRSRISIPFLSNNRPVQVTRSSPVQTSPEPNPVISSTTEVAHFHNKRASLGGQVTGTYSSRNYLIDNPRFRERSVDATSDNERNDSIGVRRASTTKTESNRLTHRSSAGLRGSRLVSETAYVEQPKSGEHIATDSTISTTAPSTVWDELDDLKSRIRKLELTGKLPATSAAAMSSTERPRTATTAATTMSTSPKYKSSEGNLQPTIEGISTNIHPLLHEALDNARVVVSHDIYQKLQATAQDALQLAAMISSENTDGQGFVTSIGNEKQIKRRTEGMCRSLTELAITLAAEAKPMHSVARPVSRDQSLPPNSMLRSRRYSNDPADRSQAPTRVQSRLDSRRTSVHLGRNTNGFSSPEHGPYHSPGPVTQLPDPKINRSSTLLRPRGQGSFDGVDEQYDASPGIRPGSRAMTDLGAYRRISRDQMPVSREYLNQHPLPVQLHQTHTGNTVPLPTNVSASLTSRRKYASPNSGVGTHDGSPITPREAWGRITTVAADSQSPDVVSEAGGSGRLGTSRRSLGFAGRIGPSVGSRLRAVRAERDGRQTLDLQAGRDMSQSIRSKHTRDMQDGDLLEPERT